MHIHIENSKSDTTSNTLETTKLDNINHGIGIKSIRNTFDKYDGSVRFEDQGEVFVVKGYLNVRDKVMEIA